MNINNPILPPTYVSTYLSIYLCIYLAIDLLTTYLPTYLPTHAPTYLLPIYLHTNPPTHLLIYPLVHLFTYLATYTYNLPIGSYLLPIVLQLTYYLLHSLLVIWNKHVK
jgi:hypothetical protein